MSGAGKAMVKALPMAADEAESLLAELQGHASTCTNRCADAAGFGKIGSLDRAGKSAESCRAAGDAARQLAAQVAKLATQAESGAVKALAGGLAPELLEPALGRVRQAHHRAEQQLREVDAAVAKAQAAALEPAVASPLDGGSAAAFAEVQRLAGSAEELLRAASREVEAVQDHCAQANRLALGAGNAVEPGGAMKQLEQAVSWAIQASEASGRLGVLGERAVGLRLQLSNLLRNRPELDGGPARQAVAWCEQVVQMLPPADSAAESAVETVQQARQQGEPHTGRAEPVAVDGRVDQGQFSGSSSAEQDRMRTAAKADNAACRGEELLVRVRAELAAANTQQQRSRELKLTMPSAPDGPAVVRQVKLCADGCSAALEKASQVAKAADGLAGAIAEAETGELGAARVRVQDSVRSIKQAVGRIESLRAQVEEDLSAVEAAQSQAAAQEQRNCDQIAEQVAQILAQIEHLSTQAVSICARADTFTETSTAHADAAEVAAQTAQDASTADGASSAAADAAEHVESCKSGWRLIALELLPQVAPLEKELVEQISSAQQLELKARQADQGAGSAAELCADCALISQAGGRLQRVFEEVHRAKATAGELVRRAEAAAERVQAGPGCGRPGGQASKKAAAACGSAVSAASLKIRKELEQLTHQMSSIERRAERGARESAQLSDNAELQAANSAEAGAVSQETHELAEQCWKIVSKVDELASELRSCHVKINKLSLEVDQLNASAPVPAEAVEALREAITVAERTRNSMQRAQGESRHSANRAAKPDQTSEGATTGATILRRLRHRPDGFQSPKSARNELSAPPEQPAPASSSSLPAESRPEEKGAASLEQSESELHRLLGELGLCEAALRAQGLEGMDDLQYVDKEMLCNMGLPPIKANKALAKIRAALPNHAITI